VLILGQRLVTYHSPSGGGGGDGGGGITLRAHTGGAGLLLCWCRVVDDDDDEDPSGRRRLRRRRGGIGREEEDEEDACAIVRYLIGDEYGRLHLLSLMRDGGVDGTTRLCLDVLGTATASSSLSYLGNGRVFVGSAFGNSQLVRILDSPVVVVASSMTTVAAGTTRGDADDDDGGGSAGGPLADTTYVEVLEEYDNLGPIVDFDLRPCGDASDHPDPSSSSGAAGGTGGRPAGSSGGIGGGRHRQSIVVTCSGVGKDGTVRLVRNGVGMREHAAVEMGGIVGMWNLRRKFEDIDDSFLVQSFVRETRVLGVQSIKDVAEMEDNEDGGGGAAGEEKSEMELEEDEGEEEYGEGGGALAEVTIPGFNSSKSTLFAGNLTVGKFDLLLQVVEDGVRLIDSETLAFVAQWSPLDDSDEEEDEPMGFITVASANESGQIVVALRGGVLVYLLVQGEAPSSSSSSSSPTIRRVRRVTLDREISCVDLNPFGSSSSSGECNDIMEIDGARHPKPHESRKSQLVAVGLWDDFSVRLLNLVGDPSSVLEQVLHINLGRGSINEGTSQLTANDDDPDGRLSGQHMMARSLCLVTMDSHATTSNFIVTKSMKSSAAPGSNVDMLLVGLGDGKLISFVVSQAGSPSRSGWSIHSRKEVSLGTQGVRLIPFQHGSSKSSGSCVLATGDRPTVVYLTGGNAGSNSNPKLNYSTVSLTVDDDDDDEVGHASHKSISVNVAAPFRSSLLFSSANAHSSSMCVADDSTLRLGMIDNIQKLHVTSFKLGMTPRRIAYHEAGRVYCVGCIAEMEHGGEANQNNCVRFFDDSTFEELNW
jgi:DNA damage-binding protein 1